MPFGYNDFHQPYCEIYDYNNPEEVRNCYLVSLNDLNGGTDYVRQKIADYINDLISIGVKGFRVDASKHMWPGNAMDTGWPRTSGTYVSFTNFRHIAYSALGRWKYGRMGVATWRQWLNILFLVNK